jgi:hypothetical protein
VNLGCLVGFHKWKGCQCRKCSKTREGEHDWTKNCGKCAECGKMRPAKHSWDADCELCSKCQATRPNSHRWKENGCIARCSACNARIYRRRHMWKDGVCQTCRESKDGLREWLKTNIDLHRVFVEPIEVLAKYQQRIATQALGLVRPHISGLPASGAYAYQSSVPPLENFIPAALQHRRELLNNLKLELAEVDAVAQSGKAPSAREGTLIIQGTGKTRGRGTELDRQAIIGALGSLDKSCPEVKPENVRIEFIATPNQPNDFQLYVTVNTSGERAIEIQQDLVAALSRAGFRL